MKKLRPITDGHNLGRTRADLTGQRFGMLTALHEAGRAWTNVFWECRCDCGRATQVITAALTSGRTKSCGHIHNMKPPGVSAQNNCYAIYRQSAMKRGYPFILTLEQFIVMTRRRCVYCGVEPFQVHAPKGHNGHFVYNGIDRVDNTQGYTIENCVPCCGQCNRAKRAQSHAAFVTWLDRIADYRSKNQ